MVACPKLTPFSFGATVAEVANPGMMNADVTTATLLGSELLRVTKSPPAGAGEERVTWNATVWPGPTTTFAGNSSPFESGSVAVVSGMFGSELA